MGGNQVRVEDARARPPRGVAGRRRGDRRPRRGPPGTRPRLGEPSAAGKRRRALAGPGHRRSEEHTSELQSRRDLVCRLLLEKKKKKEIVLPREEKKKKT